MTNMWTMIIAGLVVILVTPLFLSYLVEVLRSVPSTPTQLKWDPQIPIRHIEVNGIKLRYITAG